MQEELLLTPGPTPVARRTYQAMSQGIFGHRTNRFKALSADIQNKLQPLFGTDHPVAVLTSSGTSALEAAMVNLVDDGDSVVIIVSGRSEERRVGKECRELWGASEETQVEGASRVDT